MLNQLQIRDNIASINDSIMNACVQCGRDVKEINIVAASKTQSIEVIRSLDELKLIKTVGENRVQEFTSKYEPLQNMNWHFIGQLQSNKVKYLVGKVDLIHSLDRLSLAEAINDYCQKKGVTQECLVEVKIKDEEAKGGYPIADIDTFISEIVQKYPHIKLRGLMSVMPLNQTDDMLDECFESLKVAYDRLRCGIMKGKDFNILSAGMSGDYKTAIKHGANTIRLGRAIFGERNVL